MNRTTAYAPTLCVATLFFGVVLCPAQPPAAITNLATGAIVPIGAANAFKPLELVRPWPRTAGGPTIEYRMMWPMTGEPAEALDAVRAEIWAVWAADAEPVDGNGYPADVDAAMRSMADAFAETHAAADRNSPDDGGGWRDRRKIDAVGRVGHILSVTVLRERAAGGPPIRRIDHRVFDQRTGRRLRVEDWFLADVWETLTRRIAEAAGLADPRSVDRLKIDNYSIRPDGLHFTLPTNGHPPQAVDPLSAHLPFDALLDLFRPEAATLLAE